MSSRPRKAVIAPVGSLSAARATGRPYRSDEPLMFLMAAAAAMAAAVSPTSSTTMRSHRWAVSATTSSMSRTSGPPGVSRPACPAHRLQRNEWSGLAGWAHDYRFARFLRSEAQWDQGLTEDARKRHSDGKQCHEHRRDDHDVTEAAETKLLAEALRARRSDRRDDLAPLVLDRPFFSFRSWSVRFWLDG